MMYLHVNQLAFDLLPPLPALLAISNPQLRHTANKGKRLNHFALTDDTAPLTPTLSTVIRRVIRVKSALYVANPDTGLQTTQRMRGTRE
jgi:hypothetical protein